MQNKEILEIIVKFSPAKRQYEEKKSKKLGYDSFYDYILYKVKAPISVKYEERKALLSQSKRETKAKVPSELQLNTLLEHYKSERFSEAENSARSLSKQFPHHNFSWKILGAVLKKTGRASDAVFAGIKTIEITPDDPEAHFNFGNTLQKIGRLEEAEASYTQAIVLKPNYTKAHSNLGNTLQELGRLEEAEASYKQAIVLQPDYAEPHFNLGNTLQELGRLEEAETSYIQAIALKSDYTEAHLNLALIKRFEAKDEQYLKMLKLYPDTKMSEEERCHINFGLAKAYEDLEDFEKAFAHYNEGNTIRKKILNYDFNQDEELFRQIKCNYSQIVQRSLKLDNLSRDITPIFIVGMPRSGTTLVEQIISSHSQVTGAGELSFAAQFGTSIVNGFSKVNDDALLKFRENYLKKLKKISKENFIVTDKMPQNFRFIGLLAAAFPEAKIVHVKRNPAAVCWANYKQYFVSKNLGYCYALDDVISYHHLYENLMEFWDNSLKERIFNLDYESLVENQESETRQLIDYLGLDWDEKCLSPQNNKRRVTTASNIQVRKKIYQGSSQQWKKYEPFINGAFDDLLQP